MLKWKYKVVKFIAISCTIFFLDILYGIVLNSSHLLKALDNYLIFARIQYIMQSTNSHHHIARWFNHTS